MDQDAGRPSSSETPPVGDLAPSPNWGWRFLVGEALFLTILLFLLVGRVEIGEWVKVGGKVENLFPLLLIARLLQRRPLFSPFPILNGPLLYPCVMLLGGMLLGSVYHLSEEGLEELGRYILQAATGLYIAAGVIDRFHGQAAWAWIWLVGLAVLQFRTPWTALDKTDLEGPLGHRNLQATFYLLALPLLALAVRRLGVGRLGVRILAGGLITSQFAFMLMSRSRSGLLGFVTAGILGFAYWAGHRTPRDRHFPLAAAAFLFGAVILTSAMLPRLWAIGRELTDPYHLTRTGIWSAAVEGFHNPERLLTGVGMGNGYFWMIQESAMGNLNHRYRRGHHPHCLYLMWVYWGGVLSLAGWLWILWKVQAAAFSFRADWVVRLIGCVVLGYAAIEVVETTMLNPKIATLFWINLCLLAGLSAKRGLVSDEEQA